MLEARTWVPAWLGSAGVLAWALRRLKRVLSQGRVVLMAVTAALVFALQMLNFPVAGGTSGHFSGGAAAASSQTTGMRFFAENESAVTNHPHSPPNISFCVRLSAPPGGPDRV
jgi:hypothetical protein